jgi:type IV secretory pathway VirB9-like protein
VKKYTGFVLLLGILAVGGAPAGAQQVLTEVLPQSSCLDGGAPSPELVARANGGELRTAECLIYPYGAGKPRLVCAMNRTCHIVLQDGEELRDKSLPDPRWIVEQMRGPNQTVAVVVKPRFCDITSNLFFSTNRRFYSILLDSAPCGGADVDSTRFNPRLPYTDVLIFYYPDGGVSSFDRNTPQPPTSQASSGVPLPTPAAPAPAGDPEAVVGRRSGPLHLAYEVRFDRGFPWVPTQVYDDGATTFIYYPERARLYPFPIVYEVAPNGSLSPVTFRNSPEHGFIAVDRVATRLALVIGQAGSTVYRLVLQRKGSTP